MQFGEIDIDSELVASKESLPDSGDQIMMLNNGCMCCTVKEDLVEMLNDLVSGLLLRLCIMPGGLIFSLMPANCCIIGGVAKGQRALHQFSDPNHAKHQFCALHGYPTLDPKCLNTAAY